MLLLHAGVLLLHSTDPLVLRAQALCGPHNRMKGDMLPDQWEKMVDAIELTAQEEREAQAPATKATIVR